MSSQACTYPSYKVRCRTTTEPSKFKSANWPKILCFSLFHVKTNMSSDLKCTWMYGTPRSLILQRLEMSTHAKLSISWIPNLSHRSAISAQSLSRTTTSMSIDWRSPSKTAKTVFWKWMHRSTPPKWSRRFSTPATRTILNGWNLVMLFESCTWIQGATCRRIRSLQAIATTFLPIQISCKLRSKLWNRR